MFGTVIVHRVVLLGQQAQLLDVLLGDAQLHCLTPARRLDRPANALGRGLPDDRDGGGRPGGGRTAPLSYCCLMLLPGRQTVRSP